MRQRIAALIGLMLVSSLAGIAQTVTSVPPSMNFQGRVSRPNGTPIPDGTIPEVIFRIYASSTATTPLWSQTFGNVAVRYGVISVLLGSSQNPITPAILNGTPYLGITVNNDPELIPRQAFATTAFAFKAATVPDGSITASKFAASFGVVPSGYQILSPVNIAPPGYTATGFTVTANSIGMGSGTFTTKAVIPVPASSATAAACNGLVYLFKGTTTYAYNPVDNTWQQKANIPAYCDGGGAVTVGSKIYVFTPANVYEYDPSANTFSRKGSVPNSAFGSGYAAMGTKIYVIDSTQNREYDTVTNFWTSRTEPPISRILPAAAAAGGKIYLFGGYTGTALTNVDEYDPVANLWSAKTPMAVGRVAATATAVGSTIFIFGGGDTNANPVSAPVASYDITTNTWTNRINLPVNRYYLTSAFVNNNIYVMGGNVEPNNQHHEYAVPTTSSILLYLFQKN